MMRLIDILDRYSKATNIPLTIENGSINLDAFFLEVNKRGYLSLASFEKIKAVLN